MLARATVLLLLLLLLLRLGLASLLPSPAPAPGPCAGVSPAQWQGLCGEKGDGAAALPAVCSIASRTANGPWAALTRAQADECQELFSALDVSHAPDKQAMQLSMLRVVVDDLKAERAELLGRLLRQDATQLKQNELQQLQLEGQKKTLAALMMQDKLQHKVLAVLMKEGELQEKVLAVIAAQDKLVQKQEELLWNYQSLYALEEGLKDTAITAAGALAFLTAVRLVKERLFGL